MPGHRLPLQAGDTAEGTAYVGSYNFSSVEQYQQWLRAAMESYLFVTIAADWRAGHGTRSAYNPHAGA
jgi:hypothetical protein